jgi:hypothetical protein
MKILLTITGTVLISVFVSNATAADTWFPCDPKICHSAEYMAAIRKCNDELANTPGICTVHKSTDASGKRTKYLTCRPGGEKQYKMCMKDVKDRFAMHYKSR